MAAAPLVLYGNHESGHTYKVRLFLLLAGIDHEYRWVDLDVPLARRDAGFREAAKFGEVPVVVCDGVPHCQSNAILLFLARKFGALQGRPVQWAQIEEWLSWETNRIGFSVPNLRHALRWEAQPEAVLRFLRARAAADLATLEHWLTSQRFLLGEALSIADLSCAGYLFWIDEAGLSLEAYTNIRRWLGDIAATPGWAGPPVALRRAAATAGEG